MKSLQIRNDRALRFQFLLLVIACFFIRYKTIMNLEFILYIVMLIIPFFYFFTHRKIGFDGISFYVLFLAVLFVGSFFTNNLANSLFVSFSKMVIFIVFFYLCEHVDWEEHFIKLFSIVSFAFVLFGILELIIPSFVDSVNQIILTDDAYSFFRISLSRNVYVGIAPQTSYQVHFVLPLLAFSFCSLLVSKKKRIFHAILLSLCVIAVIITAKRMPLVSMIISMLVCIIIALFFQKKKRARIILISLSAFLFLGFVLLSTPLGGYLIDRLSRTEGIDVNRGLFWKNAIQLWKRSPIIGVGTNFYAQNSTASVHNSYLQILCENGIIGEIFFIIVIFKPFVQTFKILKNKEIYSTNNSKVSKMLCVLLVSLFVQVFAVSHSFTESIYANNIMFLPYIIYSAIPFSMNKILRSKGEVLN